MSIYSGNVPAPLSGQVECQFAESVIQAPFALGQEIAISDGDFSGSISSIEKAFLAQSLNGLVGMKGSHGKKDVRDRWRKLKNFRIAGASQNKREEHNVELDFTQRDEVERKLHEPAHLEIDLIGRLRVVLSLSTAQSSDKFDRFVVESTQDVLFDLFSKLLVLVEQKSEVRGYLVESFLFHLLNGFTLQLTSTGEAKLGRLGVLKVEGNRVVFDASDELRFQTGL